MDVEIDKETIYTTLLESSVCLSEYALKIQK